MRTPNLDALFAARVRLGVGAALADVHGTVVFDSPPAGRWTLRLADGRVRLDRGGVRHPAAVIRAAPETLAGLLEGRQSGVQAFLDGTLTMRGNIALALQIDGAFDVGVRPVGHPRAVTVAAGGVRSAYLEAGPADAPPVILLHGLGATNASMLPLIPALAGDHRVLAVDLPGFGASGAPRWAYTPAELARWLAAFQQAVGANPAALVGNSLGGRVAIEAALTAPASVTRIVLLCPSPAFRRMRQAVPALRLVSPDLAQVPLPPLHHRLVVAGIRFMFSQPDRLPRTWYDAAADEFRRVMSRAAHRRAFFACLRQIYTEEAYGERGFWDRLPTMTVPALFVWGARDRLVPAAFERHVVAAVPTARSLVLDDCGHVPQFEWPRRTAEITRAFLDDAVAA